MTPRLNQRQRALALLIGAAILLMLIAIAGLCLNQAALITDFSRKNLPPSLEMPFGTDWMGRDMLGRTLAGLSLSIRIGALTAAFSAAAALALGTASAALGGWVDAAVSWVIDLVMGIPHILLIMLISMACGRGLTGVVAGVSLTHWPALARLIRGEVLQLRQAPYLQTVRRLEVPRGRILQNHLLPHLLPEFGTLYPEIYFTVQHTNSQGVLDGLLDGLFDVGLLGLKGDDRLTCIPFCEDRIVLIAPVAEPYLSLRGQQPPPLTELLTQPIILREKSSGSRKTADLFLDSMGIHEDQLHVIARMNDQEAIKNLVAGGLGVSLISERAARNFVEEKRVLKFDLPSNSGRTFYLAYRREHILRPCTKNFLSFAREKYANE